MQISQIRFLKKYNKETLARFTIISAENSNRPLGQKNPLLCPGFNMLSSLYAWDIANVALNHYHPFISLG